MKIKKWNPGALDNVNERSAYHTTTDTTSNNKMGREKKWEDRIEIKKLLLVCAQVDNIHTNDTLFSGMCRVLFFSFFLLSNGRFPGTRTCRHVRPPQTEHKSHQTQVTGAALFFLSSVVIILFFFLLSYLKICWSATTAIRILFFLILSSAVSLFIVFDIYEGGAE